MNALTIHPLRTHPILDFACEELRQAASQRTGRAQASSADPTVCYVGTWEDCQSAGIPPGSNGRFPWQQQAGDARDPDSYAVWREGTNVVIAGRTERSTLYAVYHYAKEAYGLAWIYPGETSVIEAAGPGAGVIHRPAFRRRGFVYETVYDAPYMRSVIDWLAKNRMNELFLTFPLWDRLRDELEPELAKRGIELTLGGHSMKFFQAREGGGASAGRAEDAPAPLDQPAFAGRRQADYGDETWQEEAIERIVDYCRSIPSLTRLSLWPEDTAVKSDDASRGSFLNDYIRFTEKLQQRLREAGCGAQAEHIAYNAGLSWEMLELPERVAPSGSVDTLFAYWGRDYARGYPEADRAEERRALHALTAWARAAGERDRRLTVFEYYSDHYMLSSLFPSLSRRIFDDLASYRCLGVSSIVNLVVPYDEPGYDWQWAQGMNSYLFARAAWGDESARSLEDYYAYYPEEHRPAIRQAIERTGGLAAALTRYNVPLFPSRVMDAKGTADRAAAAEITAALKELCDALSDVPAAESGHDSVKAFQTAASRQSAVAAELYMRWKGYDEKR